MKVLLDTCVISESAGLDTNNNVVAFLRSFEHDALFLSVITIGEIMRGISLLPRGKRRFTLLSWFHALQTEYSDRILPINVETARIWGEVSARVKQAGFHLPVSDGLLAATALHHGLHVVTRNEKNFEHTGALIINPWN